MEIKRIFDGDWRSYTITICNYEWGQPIRLGVRYKNKGRYWFYFDEGGVYREDREKYYGSINICRTIRVEVCDSTRNRIYYECLNDWQTSSFYRGLVRLKPGQTFDDWVHLSMDIYLHPNKYGWYVYGDEKKAVEFSWKQKAKENPMIRYVTMNGHVKFARIPENENKGSFDYILASAYISAVDDKFEFVKEHKKEVLTYMLDHISNMKRFKKYGVPIGILKVGKCVLGRDGYLYVTFEIKDELRKLFEADKEENYVV